MLIFFFCIIAACTFFSAKNWRYAPFMAVVVAALQDPVRKMTPGAPPMLALSIVPIFGAGLFNLIATNKHWLKSFALSEKRIYRAMKLFVLSLFIPTLIMLSYGGGTWKLAIIGGLFYGTLLSSLIFGMYFGLNPRHLTRLLMWHAIVTAIMLIGVPLEYFKVFPDWLALGTEAMNMKWIRHIPGHQIKLIAGFYRSPDVMGWHASVMTLSCLTLAQQSRKWSVGLLWITLSAWGGIGVLLCGRRKMAYMIPVYLIILVICNIKSMGRLLKQLAPTLISGTVLFLAIFYFVGSDKQIESTTTYYFDTADKTTERFTSHGFTAVIETLSRKGSFLGAGIGAAATGSQNLGEINARPRAWQEGGLSRLAVELGFLGIAAFLYLAYTLISQQIKTARTYAKSAFPIRDVYIGIFAITVANALSFVVSGQIFGDPFVGFFFATLFGSLIAGKHWPHILTPKQYRIPDVSDIADIDHKTPTELVNKRQQLQ